MIIWLASYPKSGNTWLRSFLVSYYFSSDGNFRFEDLSRIPDYPNKIFFDENIDIKKIKKGEIYNYWESTQNNIRKKNKAKFLKTHNSLKPINNIPFTKSKNTLGVIHIVRDPRNVITSIKNHFGFSDYEIALKYMQTEGAYMEGEDNARYAIVDSWKTHFISWMKNQSLKRISIRYEDLVNSPEKEFTKVVEFVDALLNIKVGLNRDKFIKSLNSTKFDILQKGEEEGKFSENVIRNDKKVKFFNMGPKNNWKNVLPKDIQIKMNDYYKEDLKNLGYEDY